MLTYGVYIYVHLHDAFLPSSLTNVALDILRANEAKAKGMHREENKATSRALSNSSVRHEKSATASSRLSICL